LKSIFVTAEMTFIVALAEKLRGFTGGQPEDIRNQYPILDKD